MPRSDNPPPAGLGGADADRLPDGASRAALEARIRELEEAVEARDQFIATAAHELRNPMLPILLMVQRLVANADRGDDAQLLAPELRRLERIVDRYVSRATMLMDVSRITAGRQNLVIEEVDLSELVREVAADYGEAARRAGSPLRLDVARSGLGQWDRLAMRQIVENLVSNAIKYGNGQPIEIALRCGEADVELAVRDQGIGIKPDDQQRVFDRFERAVTHRTHGGFGIGLWVANQLVTAMAGRINIESADGAGSLFTVTLPVKPR